MAILYTISKKILIICALIMTGAGLFVLFDPTLPGDQLLVSHLQFFHQLLYVLLGLIGFVTLSRPDQVWYRNQKTVLILFGSVLVLLVLVLVFGSRVNGARSWFDFGIFSLQPSDIAKLVFMLFIAHFYNKKHNLIKDVSVLSLPLGAVVLVSGLLLLQPDFGTMIIFIVIWFCVTVSAGLWWKHTLILLSASVALLVFSWFFVFAGYQKNRIISFLNPASDPYGSGYNVVQSKIAIGSAGLLGAGIGQGTQGRLGFLPEHHTDFVFASFVEEWGFVGSFILIIALMTFLTVIFVSSLYAHSAFDALFMVGYASFIAAHALIHIGMNIGVLPVTGLPMPFMSYGGSHILTEWLGFGIVVSMMSKMHMTRATGEVNFLGPQKYSMYR